MAEATHAFDAGQQAADVAAEACCDGVVSAAICTPGQAICYFFYIDDYWALRG